MYLSVSAAICRLYAISEVGQWKGLGDVCITLLLGVKVSILPAPGAKCGLSRGEASLQHKEAIVRASHAHTHRDCIEARLPLEF